MKRYFLLILAMALNLLFVPSSFAHPGNTADDGCHYCRTNCDSWGVAWNQRHCHGGGSSSSYNSGGSYSAAPSCPANSLYSGGSCTCNSGYAPSLDRSYCVNIPANAREAYPSTTDVWLCDEGYIEVGNSCVKEEPEIVEYTEEPPSDDSDENVELAEDTSDPSGGSDDGTLLTLALIALGGWYGVSRLTKKKSEEVTQQSQSNPD